LGETLEDYGLRPFRSPKGLCYRYNVLGDGMPYLVTIKEKDKEKIEEILKDHNVSFSYVVGGAMAIEVGSDRIDEIRDLLKLKKRKR